MWLERFKNAFQPASVDLMPFTVLTGRNGSGKSTLVQALHWLDSAIRRDVREASDPYYGVFDLINLRQRRASPHFQLRLRWQAQQGDTPALTYQVRVEEGASGVPVVAAENLEHEGQGDNPFIWTEDDGLRLIRRRSSSAEARRDEAIPCERSDDLALRYGRYEFRRLGLVDEFWSRAVFLRLCPGRIGESSPAKRKSFEALLDEEGLNLPALLGGLKSDQLNQLLSQLKELLPGVEGIMVSHSAAGRDTPVYYSLHERVTLPSGGTMYPVPIPAWALSDGTRRLTAILALLAHRPAPSLICIEEIENGLDPWVLKAVLQHLRAAVERGTQVIVTTHSPWVLDNVPMDSIIEVRRSDGDVLFEHFASRPEIQAFDDAMPASVRYLKQGEP